MEGRRKQRLWIALVLCLLCWLVLREFGGVVVFFGVIFGLSALGVYGRRWWVRRRERLRRESEDAARTEAEEAAVNRRLEACRETRYAPEERERAEARVRRDLGPVVRWDPGEPGEALEIDVALIPPTEALPFWKAATVGAGACTIEAGGYQINPQRIEWVMALPPDWDLSESWPGQILRSVAWYCLITRGFGGYFVYRGLALAGAGFAGAVADSEFPGLPELACTAMPGAPAVEFHWVVPLLKPELEYVLRRGLCNLERRIRSVPWADPRRKPWADAGAWFEEDIAPFVWSEYEGRFCLGLRAGEAYRERFLRAGLCGSGRDWERLVREYVRQYQPRDGAFLEFACDEDTFFAASEDREIVERLALGLSDLLREGGAWRLLMPER